jgi:hypothetical protein
MYVLDVNKSIDFIERFVRNVSIGPDMFQVAVVTYNVEPTVLFDLDDHKKEEGIIDAITIELTTLVVICTDCTGSCKSP